MATAARAPAPCGVGDEERADLLTLGWAPDMIELLAQGTRPPADAYEEHNFPPPPYDEIRATFKGDEIASTQTIKYVTTQTYSPRTFPPAGNFNTVRPLARRSLTGGRPAGRRASRPLAASGSPGRESGGDDPPGEPPPPLGRLQENAEAFGFTHISSLIAAELARLRWAT